MAVPELPASSISVCVQSADMTVQQKQRQYHHLVSVGTRMEPITAHPDMCNSAITIVSGRYRCYYELVTGLLAARHERELLHRLLLLLC